jgi:fatty acid amide hydrolase
MSFDHPASISARDIAAQVANGELSAAELVRSRCELIDRCNPRLNAMVAPRYDEAIAEAAAIDAARQAAQTLGALAGVPISVKEALDVAGLASTGGITAYAAERATADCAAVAALRRAGAIVLGKSNLSQALIFVESDNPLFGRCNHPEREDRSPGGSSGGEGALLAVGASTLGLGTDIGGSGRIPAAFCGVASLKPTAGRLPDPQRLSVPVGQLAVPSQLVPMARRVADVELMLGVLNPESCTLTPSSTAEVSRLRVGVYEHDGLFTASPGVRRAVREAAAALRAGGAAVVEFRIPEPDEANALYLGALSADGGAGLTRLLRGSQRDPRVSQLLLVGARSRALRSALAALAASLGQTHLPELLRAVGKLSVDDYWLLCERQIEYRARFAAAMDASEGGPLDLLLGPVVATPAFTHGAAKDLGNPGIYTTLYNLLGWPAGVVPVTRVRAGEESDRPASRDLAERAAARVEAGSAGLPLAVQVAARPWREHLALAAMAVIERFTTRSSAG